MKPIEGPAAVVAKAEIECDLPGFDSFFKQSRSEILDCVQAGVENRLKRLELARRIFEYAAQPEVVEATNCLNATTLKRASGGRKFAAHTLAMLELSRRCKVTPRTLRNWANDWREIAAQIFPADPSGEQRLNVPASELQAVIAANKENLNGWLQKLDGYDPEADEGALGPEDAAAGAAHHRREAPAIIGKRLADKVVSEFQDSRGNVRVNPDLFESFLAGIKPVLEAYSVKVNRRQKGNP
jgi:hypothetical protein